MATNLLKEYWKNEQRKVTDRSAVTDTSKLFAMPEDKSNLNPGHYYKEDGTYIVQIGNSSEVYVLTVIDFFKEEQLKNSTFFKEIIQQIQSIGKFEIIFKKLAIDNTELNQRALWVYSECAGSNETISEIKNNFGSFKDEIVGLTVSDTYAIAINNGVIDNGSWSRLTDKRMSKLVEGKPVSTKNDFFLAKAPAGTPHGRALTQDYNQIGSKAFEKHYMAVHARESVIKSLGEKIKIGGYGHWLGGDDAQRYYNNENEKTPRTKTIQFSFKSSAGYHSFYKWDN